MGVQVGFFLNLDRCVQCHACEVACRAYNEVEIGIKPRQIIGMWIGQYPELINRTITFSCMHCGEPPCVDVCPTGAIIKRAEDGIVVVDRDACNGCGVCAETCPFGVIQFDQDGIMQKCDMCLDRLSQGKQPICVETCPSDALQFGPLEVLSQLGSTQQLEGPEKPSMLISCDQWSVVEPLLPWKTGKSFGKR